MIKVESIENLKSIVDVVDVIGNYIQLKKKGSNFTANCPFHSEKTPSFVVSPSKQIYHCFGCGVTGDSIKFLMDYEKLSYPEAIEKLANFYNFKLEYTKNTQTIQNINLLDKLNGFYKQNLIQNKTAFEYLKERGLFETTIEKFGLGFAPSTQKQIQFLNQINIPINSALELGVFAKTDDKIYGRLIDRITFPIFSNNNKIIAYGGRTISNHPAKYINYTNTKLFNKSRTFYGFNFAREKILRKKEIIITEGYMDVIMLHQAGFTNAVATLGTALTNEHLPLLKKLNVKIILSYDGDEAGINAAIKASTLLAQNSFEGGAVIFKNGLDPADMIKNGQDLDTIFKQNTPFIEFVIIEILNKYDLKNTTQKQVAFNEIKQFIFSLPIIIQENVIRYASQIMQITPKLFKLKNSNKNNIITKKIDTEEATIIKTLYENKKLINEIVEYLTPEMFIHHSNELTQLYEENYNNSQLLDLVLNDDIKILDYNSLINSIKYFLISFYSKQIEKIKFLSISLEEKSYKIKKLRTKILNIKKGELI
jgi:DNA primase